MVKAADKVGRGSFSCLCVLEPIMSAIFEARSSLSVFRTRLLSATHIEPLAQGLFLNHSKGRFSSS